MSIINKNIKSAAKAVYNRTTSGGATGLKALELVAKASNNKARARGTKGERAERLANSWFDLHENGIRSAMHDLVDATVNGDDNTAALKALAEGESDYVAAELDMSVDGLTDKLINKRVKAAKKVAKAGSKVMKTKLLALADLSS